MHQKLVEFIFEIQSSELLKLLLFVVSGILSALYIDLLVESKNILKLFLHLIIVLLLSVGITVILLFYVFDSIPEQDSFYIFLKEIVRTKWMEFVISFMISFVVCFLTCVFIKNKKKANCALITLLFVSTVLSNVEYFANSYKLIQRPQYSAPVEALTSIINSRLSIYPFALTGSLLESIGDGNNLISDDANDSNEITNGEEYKEPSDFSGYIESIVNKTYAPNMGERDYLRKAYTLFLRGQHNDDFFNIGLMWFYMHYYTDLASNDNSITPKVCLDNALDAYKKYEMINSNEAGLYSNMSIVYFNMDDRISTRNCIRKALELGDKNIALSNYIAYIYGWIDSEKKDLLMSDADMVLKYEDNLSMYILYGACAIAENENVIKAYEFLCNADDHYQGKSAMVKILRQICSDLAGIDNVSLLKDIYSMENDKGLTDTEEAYLIRYLFVTNRYDELAGYIADVGTTENTELDIQKAAIKACWY